MLLEEASCADGWTKCMHYSGDARGRGAIADPVEKLRGYLSVIRDIALRQLIEPVGVSLTRIEWAAFLFIPIGSKLLPKLINRVAFLIILRAHADMVHEQFRDAKTEFARCSPGTALAAA